MNTTVGSSKFGQPNLETRDVETLFIEPGSSWENTYVESFNCMIHTHIISTLPAMNPVENDTAVEIGNTPIPAAAWKGRRPFTHSPQARRRVRRSVQNGKSNCRFRTNID